MYDITIEAIEVVFLIEKRGMGSLTEENYLKSIFALSEASGEVFVSELAGKLGVKLPTVNSMVKKLSIRKLVNYVPYKGIKLTEKGRKEALSIIRKHRLSELFLVRVMGLGWEEVHDIAEQLEHVKSDRFYDRIDEMLSYPKNDPHGEPIPDSKGRLPARKRTPLHEANEGKQAIIVAVSVDEKSFLDHLNAKGLQIGDMVTLKRREVFDGTITLVKNKKEIILSHLVAEKIWVTVDSDV